MLPRPPISTLFPYTTLFRSLLDVLSEAHKTDPPPRYNEASLIKMLERHGIGRPSTYRSEEHTSELQSHSDLVCRLLLEKKKLGNSIGLDARSRRGTHYRCSL